MKNPLPVQSVRKPLRESRSRLFFHDVVYTKIWAIRDVLQRHERAHHQEKNERSNVELIQSTEVGSPSNRVRVPQVNESCVATTVPKDPPPPDSTAVWTCNSVESSLPSNAVRTGLVSNSLEVLANFATGYTNLLSNSSQSPKSANTLNSQEPSLPSLNQHSLPLPIFPPSHLATDLTTIETSALYPPTDSLDLHFDWHLPGISNAFSPTFLNSLSLSLDTPFFSRSPSPGPSNTLLIRNNDSSTVNGSESLSSYGHQIGQEVDFGGFALSALLDRFNFQDALRLWPSEPPVNHSAAAKVEWGGCKVRFQYPSVRSKH